MNWFCESCEAEVPRDMVSAMGLCKFCQMGVDAENALFAQEFLYPTLELAVEPDED